MALILPRTPADDATVALRQLDALESELPNLRAHLERIATNAHQAERSAGIAADLAQSIAGIAGSIRHLAHDAAHPRGIGGVPLESVS